MRNQYQKLVMPEVVTGSKVMVIQGGESDRDDGAVPPAVPYVKKEEAAKPESRPGEIAQPALKTKSMEQRVEAEIHVEEPGAAPEEQQQKTAKESELHKAGGTGSILRVDSRRIDNLLNLVSETVITKAAFNQINNEFVETRNLAATEDFKRQLKELFDALPDYLENTARNTCKSCQKMFQQVWWSLQSIESFEGRLKSAVTKFRSTSQVARTTGELEQ